jgi:hypothetical protein
VWRTRTPFLVRHPWIFNWLHSKRPEPFAYSTLGRFCYRSVEDPNPGPCTPSLDLRLVRVNQDS